MKKEESVVIIIQYLGLWCMCRKLRVIQYNPKSESARPSVILQFSFRRFLNRGNRQKPV
jgi:hypothetical protein